MSLIRLIQKPLVSLLTVGLMLLVVLSRQPLVGAQSQERARILTQPEVKTLPSREKRWALIVGVDEYDDENITPLRGATNDANALAKTLQDYAGFNESRIIVLTNEQPRNRRPTRLNILRYLSNLKSLIPRDGLLLLSFSGHGIERNGRAFLIPSDAVYTDDIKLLQQSALNVEEVKEDIRETGVGQVLILLDACRNDPVSGKADSINPLTETYPRAFSFDVRNQEVTAFATLFATSVGARAYEDADRQRGFFSLAVVEGLSGKAANSKTGEVTLQSLVKYIQEVVPTRVAVNLGGSKKQKPFAIIEGYKADELVLAVTKGRDGPSPNSTDGGKLRRVLIVDESDTLTVPGWGGLSKEFTGPLTVELRARGLIVENSTDFSAKDQEWLKARVSSYGDAPEDRYALRWLPYAIVVVVHLRLSDVETSPGASRYAAEAGMGLDIVSTADKQEDPSHISAMEDYTGYGATKDEARRNAVRALTDDLPESIVERIVEKAKKP